MYNKMEKLIYKIYLHSKTFVVYICDVNLIQNSCRWWRVRKTICRIFLLGRVPEPPLLKNIAEETLQIFHVALTCNIETRFEQMLFFIKGFLEMYQNYTTIFFLPWFYFNSWSSRFHRINKLCNNRFNKFLQLFSKPSHYTWSFWITHKIKLPLQIYF